MAYILANNITKPIKILGGGMDRVANGELETTFLMKCARRWHVCRRLSA